MRFKRESINDGDKVFNDDFSNELAEIESTLVDAQYKVKHTTEDGKEDQLIFDPIGTNAILQKQLSDHGWNIGVNLAADDYSAGKDVDLFKSGVVGEIQFSHFTSLDSDMNRIERLYEGKLELENREEIDAAIVIVVASEMPRSNSVSHYEQALNRAAPQSLFETPTLIYGIKPPESGEEVVHNSYEKPRSRTIVDSRTINFKQTYPLNQTDFDAYTDI